MVNRLQRFRIATAVDDDAAACLHILTHWSHPRRCPMSSDCCLTGDGGIVNSNCHLVPLLLTFLSSGDAVVLTASAATSAIAFKADTKGCNQPRKGFFSRGYIGRVCYTFTCYFRWLTSSRTASHRDRFHRLLDPSNETS